ncbi:TraA family conjugative transfer protein, partial [Pseudomonas luteola]|uniref:TraA family conjugative transfer protein n=1 Tax=Pseudomonas luteola TaxID=47886 RepID=UPI0035E3DC29
MTKNFQLVDVVSTLKAKATQVRSKVSGRALSTAAVMGAMGAMMVVPEAAMAGTGGAEFDEVWQTLVDWTQGTLGRIIAIGIILVGACVGVVRQSLMTFAVGLAMGMGLYNAPTVVESIMGSTLS